MNVRCQKLWLTAAVAVVLAAWSQPGAGSLKAFAQDESKGTGGMRITVTSVMVDDQEKALKFYTEVLGFVKKVDVPVGEFRWLTVVSAAEPDGTQLLLEPNANPAARTYQTALFDQGIPATSFGVDDIQQEYERLKALGVVFRSGPVQMGPVTVATFEDTCGNLIQIAQQ